jgi:serine/threonine protein kinase
MPINAGTRLGAFEILAPLGAGGMGEVYRARDRRLQRDVAIKVLPAVLSADPERLARFEREATTLAALNHPNIAQLYGLEESGEIRALVMELVDGRDLSEIIAANGDRVSGLPLPDALRIAAQIIDALDAAHEAGVIHRDLKPANIRVRHDGTVKVLDFGLAKAMAPDGGGASSDPTNRPTLTSPMMTQQGMVLGTAAYVAPEQARGRPVDRRADIWAFGCVLFEMLAGQRPFAGDSLSDTIANVLKDDPDWSALSATTPRAVRRLLARCLQKDPRRRLQAIGDARIALEDIEDSPPAAPAAAAPSERRSPLWRIVAIAAIVFGVAGWGLWLLRLTRAGDVPPIVRLSVTPPGRSSMVRQASSSDANAHWSISPDGRQIAFIVEERGTRQLVVRALDSFDARPVAGTEGADYPFWSADSSAIGFFADGKLKRVTIAEDAVRTICDSPPRSSATWGQGVILFGRGGAPTPTGRPHFSLWSVSDTGGTPVPLADDAQRDSPEDFPQFLPDGRHFIYLKETAEVANRRIMLGSLDSPKRQELVKSSFKAQYARSGHLIYIRDGVLVAQHMDVNKAALDGPVIKLVDDVRVAEVPGQAMYEASWSGAIAYQARTYGVPSTLSWVARDGHTLESVMEPEDFITVNLAAHDRLLSFATGDNSIENEEPPSLPWIYDFDRKQRMRIRIPDVRSVETPLLSPDASKVAFAAHTAAGAIADVRIEQVSGVTPATIIAKGPYNYHPIDWSADGRYLLLHGMPTSLTRMALLSVDLQGDRTPVKYAENAASVAQGQFSPDGHFVAYASNVSDRFEVYLQRFPATSERWQLSVDGGSQPRWRRDGRELYFVAADGGMMAVPIALDRPVPGGPPVRLFDSGLSPQNVFFYGGAALYAVSQDGQRFLLIRSVKAGDPGSIRVVINSIRQ